MSPLYCVCLCCCNFLANINDIRLMYNWVLVSDVKIIMVGFETSVYKSGCHTSSMNTSRHICASRFTYPAPHHYNRNKTKPLINSPRAWSAGHQGFIRNSKDLQRRRFTHRATLEKAVTNILHSISPVICFRSSDLQPAPSVTVSSSHCCSVSIWFPLMLTQKGAVLSWPLEGSHGSWPPGQLML